MGIMDEPVEEYKSLFNFEQGVNSSYLYLSPEESFTPPGSPVLPLRGPKSPDIFPEVGEDVNAVYAVPSSPCMALTEEEQAELSSELAKVEDEIQTLSQVLAAKEKQVAEIKRKLGITPLNEFKQNLSKGWHEVTTSTAYKKTSETLSQVGQKATTAFSNVGSAIGRKLEDVR
ncbi:tumor protein D52-like isoform X5 [Carassius carassius]|nr:tumor protein D52-like isoform X5 [Carassius carassius]